MAYLEHCRRPAVQLVPDYTEVFLLSHQPSAVDNTDTYKREKKMRYQNAKSVPFSRRFICYNSIVLYGLDELESVLTTCAHRKNIAFVLYGICDFLYAFPLIVAPPLLGPRNMLCLQLVNSKFSFSSLKDNNVIFIWLIQHSMCT